MLVKPAPGLTPRDPRTMAIIPPEGVEAPEDNLDFVRLLRDGDLVAGDETAAAPDTGRTQRGRAAQPDPQPAAAPEEQA